MRLLGNRILVELKTPEEFIKAVGSKVEENLKVGDEVMFRDYGQMINIEGEEYMLLHEPDILAII